MRRRRESSFVLPLGGVLAVWSMASSPARAVDLGGTNVARDKIVVFLFIGHSNMEGAAEDLDLTPHPRVWNYSIPDAVSSFTGWEPATDPLHRWSPTFTGGGPAMPLMKRLANLYPGYYIGAIQNANASATVRWNRGGNNNRYWKLGGDNLYKEIIDSANSIKAEVTLGGIVAMLGLIEGDDLASAGTLSDDVAQMVTDMRNDLGLPDLPFLIDRQYETAPSIASQYPYWQTVRDEKLLIPGKLPRSAIVDVDGPYRPQDGMHFNGAGQVIWGEFAADLIVSNGWFPEGNQAPAVYAGGDQTVTLPASANLDGTVTDDGLPDPPGAFSTTWSKQSGPGAVTFGNANLVDTTAAFSAAGSYILQLSANDSEFSAGDTVIITVNPASAVNDPPTVDAGPDDSTQVDTPFGLVGTVADDGLPDPPGAVTLSWTVAAGNPSEVTFADPGAASTSVTFSAEGQYTLRLTADDGALFASDDVTITVLAQPSITILSPAGGETWPAGSTRYIRWTTVNIDDVSIAYSTDGGLSWNLISFTVDRTKSEWGNYPWSVPDEPSTTCHVHIAGYLGNAAPTTSGQFTIDSDSDADGLPDGWEVSYGLDPLDPADAGADPDGDGFSNLEEFLGGTDPLDGDSYPEVGGAGAGISCFPSRRGCPLAAALLFLAAASSLAGRRMFGKESRR